MQKLTMKSCRRGITSQDVLSSTHIITRDSFDKKENDDNRSLSLSSWLEGVWVAPLAPRSGPLGRLQRWAATPPCFGQAIFDHMPRAAELLAAGGWHPEGARDLGFAQALAAVLLRSHHRSAVHGSKAATQCITMK